MTVQELINELNLVNDKSIEVDVDDNCGGGYSLSKVTSLKYDRYDSDTGMTYTKECNIDEAEYIWLG